MAERHRDEKVRLVYFMWAAPHPFRWLPDWSRTWRDRVTGYRFRVVKWGWWAWSIRRDRKVPSSGH